MKHKINYSYCFEFIQWSYGQKKCSGMAGVD